MALILKAQKLAKKKFFKSPKKVRMKRKKNVNLQAKIAVNQGENFKKLSIGQRVWSWKEGMCCFGHINFSLGRKISFKNYLLEVLKLKIDL